MRYYQMKVESQTLNQWTTNTIKGYVSIQGCNINKVKNLLSKSNIIKNDIFYYFENKNKTVLDLSQFFGFWQNIEKRYYCN